MQDQKAERSRLQAVPGSPTDLSTKTDPWDQPPDSSNQDGHQHLEEPSPDSSNQDAYQDLEEPYPVLYPCIWNWNRAERMQETMGVEVSLMSWEFQRIAKHFENDFGLCLQVRRVVRVQNRDLWACYYSQKQAMIQKLEGIRPREKRLFHGTPHYNIDSICQNGFQMHMPIVHGSRFGKGHYFTEEWWNAHRYTKATNGKAPYIFTSLVDARTSSESGSTRHRSSMAGSDEGTRATESETADWTSALARLPSRARYYVVLATVLVGVSLPCDAYHDAEYAALLQTSDYDSCCQKSRFGSQYTVYKDSQVYPEYVVEYAEQSLWEERV